MSKSVKYIIAIVLLLSANLWLFFSGTNNDLKASEKYFEGNKLSSVSSFLFKSDNAEVKISRTDDGWIVNDNHHADQGFLNTLISVLERVEVGSTISNWSGEVLGSVEIEFDSNSKYRFQFASNPNKTKSYFIVDGEAKEVSVPGYRDNVIDIFILHPDQWRDRLVVDGSWRTIQNLEVYNELGDDFKITFSDKFFLLNDEQPNDSSAVVDYLNQFQQFQANEMISKGRFEEMDSIATTEPFARITLDDIKYEKQIQLDIYSNKQGQAYHLVENQDGLLMVIDARRISQILANPGQLNR